MGEPIGDMCAEMHGGVTNDFSMERLIFLSAEKGNIPAAPARRSSLQEAQLFLEAKAFVA